MLTLRLTVKEYAPGEKVGMLLSLTDGSSGLMNYRGAGLPRDHAIGWAQDNFVTNERPVMDFPDAMANWEYITSLTIVEAQQVIASRYETVIKQLDLPFHLLWESDAEGFPTLYLIANKLEETLATIPLAVDFEDGTVTGTIRLTTMSQRAARRLGVVLFSLPELSENERALGYIAFTGDHWESFTALKEEFVGPAEATGGVARTFIDTFLNNGDPLNPATLTIKHK